MTERSDVTEKCWPTETTEELIERTRREHGDATADLVAKALGWKPIRKKQPRLRVGEKEKAPKGIPYRKPTRTRQECAQEAQHWFNRSNERNKGKPGYNASGLPRSGAGPVKR